MNKLLRKVNLLFIVSLLFFQTAGLSFALGTPDSFNAEGISVRSSEWKESYFEVKTDHFQTDTGGFITGLSQEGQEYLASLSEPEVVIPLSVEGIPIIGIDRNAFRESTIKKVTFTDRIKTIGDGAFAGSALEEVDFPESLIEIQQNAFCYCALTHVEIPQSVTKIGMNSFAGNKIKHGEFIINNDEGNVAIGFEALNNNGEDSDTAIDPVFTGLPQVEDWEVADFEFEWVDDAYTGDSTYVLKGFSTAGLEKLKNNKDLVLPSEANGEIPVWVEENAFTGKELNSLKVPENYTHIQNNAFKDCSLNKVTFAESGLVYVNNSGFENNNLKEVTLPDTFKYPADAAFKGNKLTKITLPTVGQTDAVGPEAFMNNELTEVILSNNTEHIYGNAFKGNKLTEVNIPLSLKNKMGLKGIYPDAFDENPGLKNPLNPSENKVLLWTESHDNPNSLPNGNNYVVDPDPNNFVYLAKDFTYEEVSGEFYVTGFSDSGTKKYEKLGKDVALTLPAKTEAGEAVVGVSEYAFEADVLELDELIIPNGYKEIVEYAFWYASVGVVRLPDSLETIGEMAFFDTETEAYVNSQDVLDGIENSSDYVILKVGEGTPAAPTETWPASAFIYGDMKVTIIDASGNPTESTIYAVTGFSDEGKTIFENNKELELPSVDGAGKKVEAVGTIAFKGEFGSDNGLKKVSFPDGYKAIGMMAFAFNNLEGELILPETIEDLGLAAFFRNKIEKVHIPSKVTDIAKSLFRGNKLTELVFNGDIENISDLAFAENRLQTVNIPNSLKTIGEQAFTTNTGLPDFEGKVVLRTPEGNNPNEVPDKENYLIDPTGGGGTIPDYSKWLMEDFVYDGQTVKGFSDLGAEKIKYNKELVVPDLTPEGEEVLIIDTDAFRNLGVGYDIEKVTLPETVVEIGDYALQFNDIETFKMPRDLKRLGMGVLMFSGTKNLIFNEKLEYIDQACFFNCPLGTVELPASLKTIMNAAFRKCELTEVIFKGEGLETIESLGFADNKLTNIQLPSTLEEIGSQAFANNNFTELVIPDSLKSVGFKAFLGNDGLSSYSGHVVLRTNAGTNPNNIPDDTGDTYFVDPENVASQTNLDELKALIDKANGIDEDTLTGDFKGFFVNILKDAKDTYEATSPSKARVLKGIKDLKFAIQRSVISALMAKKESLDPDASTFDATLWKAVEDAYEQADKYLMMVNISEDKVNQVRDDLSFALNQLESTGEEVVYEGESMIKKTHYIEPYNVCVKVWVKDGKIVKSTNNGTITDPEGDEDHNQGYFQMALSILNKYSGKSVEDVLKANQLSELGIDAVSSATVSSNHLHYAVLNALQKSLDTDNDGILDGVDTDDDNDGINDADENLIGTDSKNADSNSDSILDGDEDADGDGITNAEESDASSDKTTDRNNDGKPDISTPKGTDAEKNNPVAKKQNVKIGDIVEAEKSIENLADLTNVNTVKFKDEVSTTEAKTVDTAVVITYNDGSIDEVEVTVVVSKEKKVIRYAGVNRLQTAQEISKNLYEKADNVVIAVATNFPDAMSGAPLAKKLNAPILLTLSDTLSDEVEDEIERLGAKNVYILGGEGAISKKVEGELADLVDGDVVRIGGNDRLETSYMIAEKILDGASDKTAYVANALNFSDALATGAVAAAKGSPVMLTLNDEIGADMLKLIKEDSISDISVSGSQGVVSSMVYDKLSNIGKPIRRNAGNNRLETSVEIARNENPEARNVYVATGSSFPDALTGSVLAAANNGVVLLTMPNELWPITNSYIEEKVEDIDLIGIFGGIGSVSNSVETGLKKLLGIN